MSTHSGRLFGQGGRGSGRAGLHGGATFRRVLCEESSVIFTTLANNARNKGDGRELIPNKAWACWSASRCILWAFKPCEKGVKHSLGGQPGEPPPTLACIYIEACKFIWQQENSIKFLHSRRRKECTLETRGKRTSHALEVVLCTGLRSHLG